MIYLKSILLQQVIYNVKPKTSILNRHPVLYEYETGAPEHDFTRPDQIYRKILFNFTEFRNSFLIFISQLRYLKYVFTSWLS